MEIRKQVSLKEITWWKIGGVADYFCSPTNIEELTLSLKTARENSWPYTILGGGSNVLISDEGIEGLVISTKALRHIKCQILDQRLTIEATCGTPKSELTKQFLKHKLSPALFLCGIPGDVGGGVVMNAGVSEALVPREFHEIVDWVEVLSWPDLTLKRFKREDLTWMYRRSEGWQPGVVAKVGISWPLEEDEQIIQKVKDATRLRLSKQPLEWPSCGSTFKNPPGKSAGALIDQAGLKGYRIGDAEISSKHANFIINRKEAKARDVMKVIEHVQSEVKVRFGIGLEMEVKKLGRWP